MPTAVCLIRNQPPYPHAHFADGLRAAGFKVRTDATGRPAPGDVLLLWNRMGGKEHIAALYERMGCKVIIAENGWIGRAGDGGKFYALCLGHHNEAGTWRVGEVDRWPLLNVDLKPWRERGKRIVVLASRGIGERGVAQPREWPQRVAHELRKRTSREVVIRDHPRDSHAPVEEALSGVHAVVTWASGAAVKAIAAGIPAFHALPQWIGAAAARPLSHDIEDPFLGDRLPMFRRLAWGQWSATEIMTGEPFRWLLS